MAKRSSPTVHGLAVVDKPAGWTSHDVVARMRKQLSERRIGHSGTLDPDATGVLLVGVGRVTRVLRFLTALPKSYVGQVVLGVETATLDAAGEVVAEHDMGAVTVDDARAAATRFVGEIEQIPPMVSAVKVGGRRLHEMARHGMTVEREPRRVRVDRFDIAPTNESHVLDVVVDCSSGTYVRTLAADLGTALGGGAHLRNLRRTAIGSFTLDEARPLDVIDAPSLLTAATALRDYAQITVGDDVAVDIAHGKVLSREVLGVEDDGPWGVVDRDGNLLAVYEPHRGTTVKPAVVLNAE